MCAVPDADFFAQLNDMLGPMPSTSTSLPNLAMQPPASYIASAPTISTAHPVHERSDGTLFALHPHELAMRVFDSHFVPLIMSTTLTAACRSISLRVSLYRAFFSHNVYMWLMQTPNPSLLDIEKYLNHLQSALCLTSH
jgi:hypothetical protein